MVGKMFPDNYKCEGQISIFDWLKEKVGEKKMYRCNDCGCEFEEPKEIKENMGEFWGMPAYETWYVCPNCNDNDYEEMEDDE